MIERIRVIGIGMGDPEHVTGEASQALATVDVFLVADKGDAKSDLVAARQASPVTCPGSPIPIPMTRMRSIMVWLPSG